MALIDDVHIIVKAGNGGNGANTYLSSTNTSKTSPDGGNGGRGGNINFQSSHNVSDLSQFRFTKKIVGNPGVNGSRKTMIGRHGEDITVLVPPGTTIIDEQTGESVEIIDQEEVVTIAKGGRGGDGNHGFRSNDQRGRTQHQEGYPGETKQLHLILNLIADIGLVGLPNAGKSSLLTSLTNATPKIGNYPFTTLEPNLGTLGKLILADIPGLIEGASQGVGLGVTFLKHIQKTKVLLHCIDAQDTDPLTTYTVIRDEFAGYNQALLKKQEIILLTKTDLVSPDELSDRIHTLNVLKRTVIPVSIYNSAQLDYLVDLLRKFEQEFYPHKS